MKKLSFALLAFILSVTSCKQNTNSSQSFEQQSEHQTEIVSSIIQDEDSFYHIDFSSYPKDDKKLPIGVFDSGTGGLTVLEAIVKFDENNNQTRTKGNDGIRDFENEFFIYLADQANMPYGNYSKENKLDLLDEHIIKDVQFLMSNKYYLNASSQNVKTDKDLVKVIVIACNTATAYGKENIEEFLKQANSDIKVIGVIDAGVRGTLSTLEKNEDAIIGVMATVGTVSSKGYTNTLHNLKDKLGYTGRIEVFSQGGLGIAEAVDEDPDYYDKNLKKPRQDYKGPSLNGEVKIDETLYDIYNFNFENSKMLCDSEKSDDCSILQINDAENYVRYHLVTLLEKIRKSETNNTLKSIILGCTHYPYLKKEMASILKELFNYKNKNGQYFYRNFLANDIKLIDPAINTAKELYDYLNKEKIYNPNGDINNSEFYISIPNKDNPNNVINDQGSFPYNYKYGRNANEIQEYVKVVPFSRDNISIDILKRLEEKIPYTYQLIENFSQNNKLINLTDSLKI